VSILDGRRKVVWGASVARPGSGATHLATEAFPTCPWAGKRVAKIVPGKAQGGRRAPRDRRARKSKRRAPAPAVTVTTGTPQSLRRAVEHLVATFGPRYPEGASYLKRLASVEKQMQADKDAGRAAFEALQREALLANPLLNFDKLLLVRRAGSVTKSLPANWQGNCMLARSGFDNEIAVLSPLRPDGKLTTLHKPTNGSFVGDVDLHWDGRRMLFSQIGRNGKWQVCEIGVDGKGLREVTRDEIAEFDNYDAAYLPDDRVVFASSAVCHGVPCVGGKTPVSNLYRMGADGGSVRQLCFDQDHNWHPSVMHDGSVLFTRWEYTDTPHYFTRLLFRMNPDGTGQFEYYGSNSFWPNSIFYARQIPGHPTRVVAVVSGHHGDRRMGELVIFDTAKGRQEADGVVQRIPGYGKRVEPVIKDRLVGGVYPRFLTPYPLSGEYFLVSAQLSPRMDWGIYLVDVFDNLTRIRDLPRESLLEPIPLRPRPRPPVIPDRVDLRRKDALVYLLDVYQGPGLRGVPRGTVKKLRVFEYHYAYNHTGGHIHVGVEGPWDVKRILGTVGVEPDGSAVFRVPANTPLAIQPLDADGEALQVMRSWFTAMPGEMLSCVGCHERQSDCPPLAQARALRRKPSEIAPWHGRLRGFSFAREVQPVLDRFCVGCHDGTRKDRPDFSNATAADATTTMRRQKFKFTRSYMALHPYVRRPGPESDYHLLAPCEYRANTSELVQMLRKGHHGVRLDAEAWDRLITWIDLNVPDHGTWAEQRGGQPVGASHEARLRMRRLYANIADDPEAGDQPPVPPLRPAPRQPLPRPAVEGPHHAGLPRQRTEPAGHPRLLGRGDGLLSLARRAQRPARHPPDGGRVGIRRPRRDRHAAAVGHDGRGLLPLGQRRRRVDPTAGRARREPQAPEERAPDDGLRPARGPLQRRPADRLRRRHVPPQRVGAARHARQRGRVDAVGLPPVSLSRRRPKRPDRRRRPRRPRRLLARPAEAMPLGLPPELPEVAEGLQRRLPRGGPGGARPLGRRREALSAAGSHLHYEGRRRARAAPSFSAASMASS